MKSILSITYGLLIGLLVGGIIWFTASKPKGIPVTLQSSPTPGQIVVYITGAVNSPGVYSLPMEARIKDLVDAAGGFLAGAEEEKVNLAALLEDGQQIVVPGLVDTSHISAGRININAATAADFDSLPGIGPTTAQAIVDYRLQNGKFATIEDIQKVPGIGPSTYDRIKDYLTAGD